MTNVPADWLNDLSRTKTETTVTVYKSALHCVLDDLGWNASDLIEASNTFPKKLQKRLKQYFTKDISHLAPLTKNQRLSALRSFLRYANEEFSMGTIEFDKSHTQMSIFDAEIPGNDTLREILEHADVKTRAALGLYAFCGLRPKIIVNLKIESVVDMDVTDDISFSHIPAMIIVRKDIPGNKAKVDFFTFLIEEGVDYLRGYLASRDGVSPGDFLIEYPTTKYPKTYLYRGIKKAFERADFDAHPYILRSYFDTAASEVLSRTKREFYMGHVGDLDVRYRMRKRHSREKIETLRQEWAEKMEPRLGTR
ncbi:MAG: hypothetical protein ACP5FL_09135 [Thermoplasmatota archaeon]